ncbi:hypothetical protein FQA39_LY10847 [Lamprigera yunnana]|nr:hypothetical protein FQA39_LY10847 [Lamprigera yunnana]
MLNEYIIPQGNRCCQDHLIKNRFYKSELEKIKPVDNEYQIPKGELTKFIEGLSSVANITTIHGTIGNSSMPDEKVRIVTGLSWDNSNNLCQKTSMPDSESRNVMQALVTFLFKMRTENYNDVISGVPGLRGHQYVSNNFNSVLILFEKDVHQLVRERHITNSFSEVARRLNNLDGKLAVICDDTYIYHGKSTNNFYQRKSYSGQKKKPLRKPFTICFTGTGHTMRHRMTAISDPNDLPKLLQPDVKNFLESLGYGVLMPALKENKKQLTAEESNG